MVSRIAVGILVVLVIAAIAGIVVLTSSSPGSSSTSSNTSGTGSSNGRMAVMGTDPPYSSGSNTKEYEHYNNIAAHRAPPSGQPKTTTTQGSSGSGWVMLNASGTLQLNTLVNASQTMALANVQATSYDAVRLYIDSAIVTYNGQNYTAQVGSGQLTASLGGNLQVNGSSTAVVLFDLRTVAVNAGTSSNPKFVVTSSARAEAVASGNVASASLQVGARTDLSTSAWFKAFAGGNAHLVVSSATISSNSLNISAKDTGSETANVTYVIVTPVSLLASIQVVIPDSLQGSAVFVVGSSGSLQTTSSLIAQLTSPSSSLSVSSSSSTTMTYSGSIQFGSGVQGLTGVQAGQSYLITVVGTNSVATTTVTAT